jgi:hypothetical protein
VVEFSGYSPRLRHPSLEREGLMFELRGNYKPERFRSLYSKIIFYVSGNSLITEMYHPSFF